MIDFKDLYSQRFENNSSVVIYGAGPAGKVNGWILSNICNVKEYSFCDRDESKHIKNILHPVVSVQEAVDMNNPIFIIGFYNNDLIKINSAIDLLEKNGIDGSRMLFINMESDYYKTVYSEYLERYIDKSLNTKKETEKINKVEKICFLAGGFSEEKEAAGGGGPIGVICMQKKMLGDKFGEVCLEYPYYETNDEYQNPINRFPYLTGSIEATYKMALDRENTIYIVNDVFSAFGLYRAGAKYRLIFHAQGDVINEMTLWGEKVSEKEIELIRKIERITFENADLVLFPSDGAKYYFDNCFEKKIDYRYNGPIYNAVTDIPSMIPVNDIEKNNDVMTFLSIGQMTMLKGIDQIPEFIEKYYLHIRKKIRWIVVSGGVLTLKDEVDKKINSLIEKGIEVEYICIDKKIDHSQIFYLFSVSDVYLMLHRVSIFDFSTLEAMLNGKAIVLSNIPGNREFCLENNIFLYEENSSMNELQKYIDNKDQVGNKNQTLYRDYFSLEKLKEKYNSFLDEYVNTVEGKL